MSTESAPARVFGFVAAEADVCVLLRRGPSHHTLMVRWDLRTDAFEIGQWLKLTVFPERCDLSPDGRLFATNALDYRPHDPVGPYVAVSRPPYFTALALWRVFGAHTTGARWMEDRKLWVDSPVGVSPSVGNLLPGFTMRAVNIPAFRSSEDAWYALRRSRMERAGLRLVKRSGPYTLAGEPLGVKWADVDHRGRILLARAGRVFVRDAEGERELIDLNPLEFRPLAPPEWATKWP